MEILLCITNQNEYINDILIKLEDAFSNLDLITIVCINSNEKIDDSILQSLLNAQKSLIKDNDQGWIKS